MAFLLEIFSLFWINFLCPPAQTILKIFWKYFLWVCLPAQASLSSRRPRRHPWGARATARENIYLKSCKSESGMKRFTPVEASNCNCRHPGCEAATSLSPEEKEHSMIWTNLCVVCVHPNTTLKLFFCRITLFAFNWFLPLKHTHSKSILACLTLFHILMHFHLLILLSHSPEISEGCFISKPDLLHVQPI